MSNYSCRLDDLVGLEGLVAEYRDQDSDLSFLDWLAAKAEAIVEETRHEQQALADDCDLEARYEQALADHEARAAYYEMQYGF